MDKDSGLVHTVVGTSANVHNVTQTENLLTGEEEAVNGDAGYTGADKRETAIIRNKQGNTKSTVIRLNSTNSAEAANTPQRKENIKSHR